jgi:hypothetical protein
MKNLATLSLAAVVTLGAFSFASAETVKPIGASVRGGLFFPSSSSAKDVGNNWFGFGVDYKVKDLNFGNSEPGFSSSLSVSVDWYGKNDFTNVPVLLNFVGRKDAFYYSAGAGLGFAKIPGESKTELAYQFSVGYDFVQGQTPAFLEARYLGSGRSDLNGFGIYAGIRF